MGCTSHDSARPVLMQYEHGRSTQSAIMPIQRCTFRTLLPTLATKSEKKSMNGGDSPTMRTASIALIASLSLGSSHLNFSFQMVSVFSTGAMKITQEPADSVAFPKWVNSATGQSCGVAALTPIPC